MTIDKIITLSLSVLGFLITVLIPTIIVLVNKWKALKEAKSEAERQQIINDILGQAKDLVVSAEEMYKAVSETLKAQGVSFGALKKDKVMTSIQQICIEKGIAFDADFWSAEVEKIVAVTKKVNATK